MSIARYIRKHVNIDQFNNRNVFITGGNSGIGFELANLLASFNANVFLLCRNLEKAENAKKEILAKYSYSHIEIIQLDLADFASIKNAVNNIKKYDIDMFVNNAGVYHLNQSTTKDGFEIIMGTNFIGPLYLNDLLIPYFKSLNHQVKIVFESSITSKVSKINYDDFFSLRKYKPMKVYSHSKVAINNMYFNYVKENENTNLLFSLVHPGITYTPLINKGYENKAFQFFAALFMKIFFHSPKKACLVLLMGLTNNGNSMFSPRGIWEIRGYPKQTKYRLDSDYQQCISDTRKLF